MFEHVRARIPSGSVFKGCMYVFFGTLANLLCMLVYGGRSFHSGRVPRRGPVLIAANHQSFIDPPFVGSNIRGRQLAYVARGGLFRFKPLGWFLSALNSVPIKENGGDMGAIKEILRVLGQGHAVVIFPEGTRTPDGELKEFKRGVALLVKKARCPVVPVAVEGIHDAWPIGKLPRLWGPRIMVLYGDPISHEELMKDGADAALERLRREIESMRMELRALIRAQTHGAYPARGPGDRPQYSPLLPARLFGKGSYTARGA